MSDSHGRLADGSAVAEMSDVLAVESLDDCFDFLGALSCDMVLVKRVGMFFSIGKLTSLSTFRSLNNGLGPSCKALAEVAMLDARSDVGAVSGLKGTVAIPHK